MGFALFRKSIPLIACVVLILVGLRMYEGYRRAVSRMKCNTLLLRCRDEEELYTAVS